MDIRADEISKIIRDQIGSYAVSVDVAEVGGLAHLLDVSAGEQVLIVHIAGAGQIFIRGNALIGRWTRDPVIERGTFGQNWNAPQHPQCKNPHAC